MKCTNEYMIVGVRLEKKTFVNIVAPGEWRSKAKSELIECAQMNFDLRCTLEKLTTFQMRSYPWCTWIVSVAEIGCNYTMKSRPGLGDMAQWTNEPNCKYNLRVYSVTTTELTDRGGICSDEDEEKAHKIVDDVGQNADKDNYSLDRVIDEVESRFNQDALHWLVIQVRDRNSGFADSLSSDGTNISSVYRKGNKYTIDVILSN